jgi:formylglycine-generating enzyme required for sulfatase activity
VADIFVSYTSSDRDWAFWIGHELDSLGHRGRIHEWEIAGGGDIPAWMEERHHGADRVLCVVSEKYLKAAYSSWERRAAQWAAGKDRPNFVLPVFVEPCGSPTLFAHLKRCDLYGLTEEEAHLRLKAFLEPPHKPPREAFPGQAKLGAGRATNAPLRFPGNVSPSAAPLHDDVSTKPKSPTPLGGPIELTNFDVFISYPHQDQAIADQVRAMLEDNGIKCWIAPRDILPSADWAKAIVAAINRCRVMLLIFSSSANGSTQIAREAQIAFEKRIPVLPFRIENVVPTDSLAYYVGSVQWLNAWTGPIEQHFRRLAESVKSITGNSPPLMSAPAPNTVILDDPRSAGGLAWSVKRSILFFATVLLSLLVGVLMYLQTRTPPFSAGPLRSKLAAEPPVTPPANQVPTFRDCSDCPEMVEIPAGRFTMGSTNGDNEEKPAHEVTIAKPFAIGKFEVTFDEWDTCAADRSCTAKRDDHGWGRGRHPVINLSWNDAQEYMAWLSHKTGKSYRLPTEAEWEYAARAGSSSAYAWGDNIGIGMANCKGCGSQWDSKQTAPVGSFAPNAFGLYDMHGNIWEWVEDCYHKNYGDMPNATKDGGTPWTTGCEKTANGKYDFRILRGGSWNDDPQRLRSAFRNSVHPLNRDEAFGFRVARTLSTAGTISAAGWKDYGLGDVVGANRGCSNGPFPDARMCSREWNDYVAICVLNDPSTVGHPPECLSSDFCNYKYVKSGSVTRGGPNYHLYVCNGR